MQQNLQIACDCLTFAPVLTAKAVVAGRVVVETKVLFLVNVVVMGVAAIVNFVALTENILEICYKTIQLNYGGYEALPLS